MYSVQVLSKIDGSIKNLNISMENFHNRKKQTVFARFCTV